MYFAKESFGTCLPSLSAGRLPWLKWVSLAPVVMEKEASQLERDHVHSVYEKIAPYFNDARYKAWPKVQQFISEQEPGSLIADIGEWGCLSCC